MSHEDSNATIAVFAVTGLTLGTGATFAYASNSVKGPGEINVAYNSGTHVLSVYDGKRDALGGRALYHLSDGFSSNLDNDKGFGTSTSRFIGGGKWIRFRACTKNGATTKECSVEVQSKH